MRQASPQLFLLLLASSAFAADPVKDQILSLPGWSDPFPSLRFSGYLNGADPSHQVSYYFVQSESSSPQEDPVVLWLNGGRELLNTRSQLSPS